MNTDSYFSIGSSHEVCEDYALNLNENMFTFIISDGCSSSEHTDIGSRILAWSAKEIIDSIGEEIINLSPSKVGKLIIDKAYISVKNLNIHPSSLDATLLIGFYDKINNKVKIIMYGDGCLFYKNKKDEVTAVVVDYTENHPFYLSYLLSSDSKNKFDEVEQDKVVITNGEENQAENAYVSTYSFDLDEIKWICLTSDGALSFANKDQSETVEESDVFDEITGFKNFSGEFIKRRSKRLIKNFGKKGITSSDDFSMAGLFLGD